MITQQQELIPESMIVRGYIDSAIQTYNSSVNGRNFLRSRRLKKAQVDLTRAKELALQRGEFQEVIQGIETLIQNTNVAKGLFAEGEDLDLQKSRRYSFYEVTKTARSVEKAYEAVRKNQILKSWEPNTALYMTMDALYETGMKLTPKQVSKLIRTYGKVPFHIFTDLGEIVSQTIRNFDKEKMTFKELIKSIGQRLVGNTSMLEKTDYEIVLDVI